MTVGIGKIRTIASNRVAGDATAAKQDSTAGTNDNETMTMTDEKDDE
jgi:hypothetical protein